MKRNVKILSVIIAAVLCVTVFSSCSKAVESTPVDVNNFRVTAYVTSDSLKDGKLDKTNFSQVTDVILIGCADYDESGKVVLNEDFDQIYANLQIAMDADSSKNVYLNIIGPRSQTESDDWNDQMHDQSDRNKKAFESGKLEQNIKATLDKYGFDGMFFDYEFPIRSKDRKVFSKFLVSLDKTLGDDMVIGAAIAAWNAQLSKDAIAVLDMVEVMSYDLWDDDGNHATMDIAKDDIEKMVKLGYDKSKLDLGLPFYARPTTEDGYWYDYKDYADKIDEKGLYKDDKTGLTFSFNTPAVIKEKTKYAIDNGVGGVMVWHYACDLPCDNEKSLFKAVTDTVKENINESAK